MKKITFAVSIAVCAIAFTTAQAQQKTGFHIIHTFHIASSGGWDYIEVGPVNDWLYVSHGTQVNVLKIGRAHV